MYNYCSKICMIFSTAGLGRFEAWDLLELGPFEVRMFWGWDILRLGTFCGLGCFGVGSFWSWDVLSWDVL
jgi:hypothetical protein